MMDKYDQNLLLGYVEGDLTPHDRARVETILAEDPRMRTLLEAMVRDREALRGMPPGHVPVGLMEQVNLQLERQMLLDEPTPIDVTVRTRKTFRLHRALIYSGLAAMVLISAGVVIQTLVPGLIHGVLPVEFTSPTATSPPMVMSDERGASRSGRDLPTGEIAETERELREEKAADADAARDAVPPADEVRMESLAMKSAAPRRGMDVMSKMGPVPPTMTQAPATPMFYARLVPVDDQSVAQLAQANHVDDETAMQWRQQMAEAPREVTTGIEGFGLAPPQASPIAVNVETDDVGLTQRELLAWARDNRIRVIGQEQPGTAAIGGMAMAEKQADVATAERANEPAEQEFAAFDKFRQEAPPPAEAATQPAPAAAVAPALPPQPQMSDHVLLVVKGSQVPQLVEYLNRRDQQLADVVPAGPGPATETMIAAEPTTSAVVMKPDTVKKDSLDAAGQVQQTQPPVPQRLAIDLSNGWGKLLQQQLPLAPRQAVYGEGFELIVPVHINVDPTLTTPLQQQVP